MNGYIAQAITLNQYSLAVRPAPVIAHQTDAFPKYNSILFDYRVPHISYAHSDISALLYPYFSFIHYMTIKKTHNRLFYNIFYTQWHVH
jgi:hypothetical protein